MSKLILIDGHAIMHRAYHALPKTLTTRKGEPINAVYGLVSMLLRVIGDLEPTHLAVAFDRKEPTFRHEEFKDYQAQRPEMDEELDSQFGKAKKVFAAMGIPVFEKAGFEADDVIGTLARQATKKSNVKSQMSKVNDVVIVTGDRDILQLVNDKVRVYLPIRGLKEAVLMGEEEVLKKMGVKPEQVPDLKALAGDPSDNYKGVPGVGPKTAVKLLKKYGDIGTIFKNLDELDESLRKKLKSNKKDIELYRKLAKIVTDVELELDIEKAGKWQVDSQKVLDLFNEFGFKTLTRRVQGAGAQIASEKQGNLF